MAYGADAVDVSKDATPVCVVGPGGVLVHNIGGAPLTLGGEGVSWERGIILATGEKLFVPGITQAFEGNSGSVVIGEAAPLRQPLLTLFACSLSGDGKIAYMVPG